MNMDNVDLRYLAFSAELFDCSVDLRLNRYFTHNEILSVLPRPHDHALCELHAVLSGEVVLECEGKRKILRAGELLLLPPATLHRYLSYGEGAALYNLRFRISKRRDSFSHKLYSAAKERFELGAPFTLKASEELSAALASLMSEYDAFVCANDNNGWRLERLRHYAALFFASLFEAASVIPKPCRCEEAENSEEALLGHIIDRYFYYNIDRNISLEELAECLSDPEGDSPLETVAIRDCLQRFLRTLSEKDRTVFTLRYFACMSNEDVGKACGLRESAVVMRLVRMRKKLKAVLEDDGITV